MGTLLLALSLALPSAAEPPGEAALRARRLLDALPVEARVELRKMYFRYRAAVSHRLESGWGYGVLSEAVIEDVDEPFQPARLLEDAVSKRKTEIAALEESLSKSSADRPDYAKTRRLIRDKKTQLEATLRKVSREKGICRDWSDAVWWELTSMNPSHWTVEDRRRQARPFHTGAVVCTSEDDPGRGICLVFDPWESGKADVFAIETWDTHESGGQIPADYFLHDLPEKTP